jgi:hypothetical protein
MACLEYYQWISSIFFWFSQFCFFNILFILTIIITIILLCTSCERNKYCKAIHDHFVYFIVKEATRLLFSSTLDITEGNAQNEDNPQDEDNPQTQNEYILTLAGNKYKFPSQKLLNVMIYQIAVSEILIIQSVLWAILPYFFLHVSNLCSPYNEEGVDCFLSHQAHHGLFAGYVDYYLVINQSACALNEPGYNITIPINCSDFFWYEQYGNSAQEVPVICFKISYSNPFIALAILTSILKTVLPALFQVVLFVYLNVLGNCLRCLNRCQCTRGLLQLLHALMIIHPTIAFFFISGVSVCIMVIIPEHIFYFLNEFGGEASTTLMLCVFFVVFLSYPCWFVLAFFKVEENEPLTLFGTIWAKWKASGKMNHRSYEPISNTTSM